jgi:predicted phosphodiesterase
MRLAVLSDIHGNLPALEAVMEDLRTQVPDAVVNLGDHLSGPLWGADTADLLMNQAGWLQIRGNHDRQLLEHAPGAMGRSDAAAFAQLTGRHLAWLATLPPEHRLGQDILLCHGVPGSDTEYLLEDVQNGSAALAGADAILGSLRGTAADVLCGHSHVPRFVLLPGGGVAANPGSVGLQAYADPDYRYPHVIENGSPHARYLILDRQGVAWRASFRILEYDWDRAALKASASDRPEWAHALRTGYALR